MILLVIGFLAFCQILLYVIANEHKIDWVKAAVLWLLLLLHFFILPSFFYPPPPPEGGGRCGMPALAVMLGFWIFGGGASIVIYLTFLFMKKRPD